jgi:hypothetical protein
MVSNDVNLPYPVVKPTGKFSKSGLTSWELQEDFTLRLNTRLGYREWSIPKGTETDFASIPMFVRNFINPIHPKVVVAALIHDELYRMSRSDASASTRENRFAIEAKAIDYAHSRFYADALFREIMVLYGAPVWMRVAAYYGVRAGGWLFWSKGESFS